MCDKMSRLDATRSAEYISRYINTTPPYATRPGSSSTSSRESESERARQTERERERERERMRERVGKLSKSMKLDNTFKGLYAFIKALLRRWLGAYVGALVCLRQ